MAGLADSSHSRSNSFQKVVAAFLAQPGLPFANVLSAERIERIFAKQGNLFGAGAIYSTAVMVWSFLGQVLRDGKEASCQSAVARIVTYCDQQERAAPTADTGDYCKARGKLSEAALRDLTREVASEVEQQADASWLWKGRHAKLVDGFTFTMPDTEQNQAEYPQAKTQKKGVGLPIARAAVILSLATAGALDLAVGPYAGKETGETALLRQLLAFLCLRGRGRGGSFLLFVYDDRLVAGSERASLCPDAPAAARGLSPGTTLGKTRSPACLDQARTTDLDGPSDLRGSPRRVGDARDSLPGRATRLSQPDDHDRHDLDRCRDLLERRHCPALWLSLELGIGHSFD